MKLAQGDRLSADVARCAGRDDGMAGGSFLAPGLVTFQIVRRPVAK